MIFSQSGGRAQISSNYMQNLNGLPAIRVLQAVGALNRGGYETWLLHMVKNLREYNIQMDFLVDANEQYAYSEEFTALGSRILPCLGCKQPWKYWTNLKRLYAAYGPYDILHSQFHYRSGLLMAMGHRLEIPVRMTHIHPAVDIEPSSPARSLYRLLMLRAIKHYSTYILACSQTSLKAFCKECPDATQPRKVLWNGVDLSAYAKSVNRSQCRRQLNIPENSPLITYVARFVPHKNHKQLMRLADLLKDHPLRPHFAIAGSHGPTRTEVEEQARQRSNVTVIAGLPDISELLLSSDIFFFPSLEEGFGVVAIEAAAAGLPVIATDLPTIQEACAPSHRGLMFRPNDDDGAIRSINRLLQDKQQREALASDGKLWARKFSILASRDALISTYEDSLAAKRVIRPCTQAALEKVSGRI